MDNPEEHMEVLAEPAGEEQRECPGCGRIMSWREAWEQGACNDCQNDGRA